ncbi:hypothetical protein GCM10010921_27260 [Microbacterium album]|uniref:Uncharacterized protein n=1 Tax=Microbacterium album TaxID=2053191 RepID=A0A917IHM6_9MICO|nr:hypothetical protein GCM10010921_27260 [Microbacterium album]
MPLVAIAGALVGALAFFADGLRGPFGAVVLGAVSSASTWMLGATVVGYLAGSRLRAGVAAAVFGAGVTAVYYTLRWVFLQPWAFGSPDPHGAGWGSPAGLRFLLVAAAWIAATAVGGAVLGVLARTVPRQRSPLGDVLSGVWLGVCLAPAIAYLPDLVTHAGATWAHADWGATADTGAPHALISALAAAAVVLIVVPALAPRGRGAPAVTRFAGAACLSTAALAVLFRLATDAVRTIAGDVF